MAGCVVLYGSGCLTLLCSGFEHRCTDGQTRYFVPTLAAFVGDIMAADTAFGILHHSAPHSDISILIHKSHLNDPEYEPEERTESQMVTVRLGSDDQHANAYLRKVSCCYWLAADVCTEHRPF